MLDTLTNVAREIGIGRKSLQNWCRAGKLKSATKRKEQPHHRSKRWHVDPDEARTYAQLHYDPSAGRPRREESRPVPEIEPAPDGGLTLLQQEVLAHEFGHELVDMQPVPGGFKTWWSDGESFVIQPNGECTEFRYQK